MAGTPSTNLAVMPNARGAETGNRSQRPKRSTAGE